ncbi:hypothetical protein DLM75_20215 [Leptospira stimsonii]|uniref:Uncharacterized protein n=1 Tax=Leptospira stimsonii TaxID=2202203 RepID=A0A396YWV1_9LEPT|nr:hypothetical protein DLM75_20215 [Leptospira stimsonii]
MERFGFSLIEKTKYEILVSGKHTRTAWIRSDAKMFSSFRYSQNKISVKRERNWSFISGRIGNDTKE